MLMALKRNKNERFKGLEKKIIHTNNYQERIDSHSNVSQKIE